MKTMVALLTVSATRSAATRAPADEMPPKMPSSAASRRAMSSASACVMDSWLSTADGS